MSLTSRWVYTNSAVVWPQGPRDPYTREPTWLMPFVIACTFANMGETQTDDNGERFVPQDTVWFEDQTPISPGDKIVIGTSDTGQPSAILDWAINVFWPAIDAQPSPPPTMAPPGLVPPDFAKVIRKVGMWDMSFFGEEPDFVLYT